MKKTSLLFAYAEISAVATEDFEEDELVFSIPRSVILNVKNVADTRGREGLPSDALAAMPNWLVSIPLQNGPR